ncbi:rad, Gem/Kir family member 3 isoform X2 [Halictus rubicundus]|uniref:rad, Gem/Kir family member 3 isoform X2 n=1 Tax=Halictus rubicundus TaxID=77578 RepID=UPI004036254B
MAESLLRRKTRSASICAPEFSSMEQMLVVLPSTGARVRDRIDRVKDSRSGTSDSSSPTRRRRSATRSQSARISDANRSSRRRATSQAVQHHQCTVKSAHCSSEPRLTDNDVSPRLKRRDSRRGQSMQRTHRRKSNVYLNVPATCLHMPSMEDDEEEDSYRLRSFNLTSKGIVNRGDSFIRRRSRSRSTSLARANSEAEEKNAAPPKEKSTYTVAMLGARGVGKTTLINQFMTSESINGYESPEDVPREQSVFVMLNGEESELRFLNIVRPKSEMENIHPDAFVVMYSVVDQASFEKAEKYLERFRDQDFLRGKSAILVGNKVDLVRTRVVSRQDGKCMACSHRVKYAEISVAINHNVDHLLVGILHQIRLKNADNGAANGAAGGGHWYTSRTVVRASMKAKRVFTWLFGKEDSKLKNCENLHIL